VKASFWRALACGAFAALGAAPTAAADSPEPPMSLPGDAVAASLAAAPGTWIVGAQPGARASALARRFGARHIGPSGTGGYVIARPRARAFADALGDLLVYAQPNTLAKTLQRAVAQDPFSVPPDDWRDWVVDPALAPPPVDANSPLIALVDAQLDKTHAEWAGGNTDAIEQFPVTNSHGTATASVAAAPVNGAGIVGIWPGARALNVPLPDEISCGRSAEQIGVAIERGAAVINMSYGSPGLCFPEYVALQVAVANGIVPVAAAGNEFADGNPLEFPASLPHVLTVAAVGAPPAFQSSFFSNANAAIDLSAPGEAIMTAVPPALDGEGTQDGYQHQSGTSFAAPMVSAAVAWVRAARPDLTADQVVQVVRLSAVDHDNPGWQPDTGFGVLNVGEALAEPAPPPDPSEPNDDIIWVDGRAFGKPDRPLFKGGRTGRLGAIIDVFEDPADVYRIRLRPHSRVKISADPVRNDDVDLRVYSRKAKSLRAKALKRSARRGKRTERITLRNRSGRARVYYVAVRVQPGSRDLDAAYALRVG
jgi:Subtilase family